MTSISIRIAHPDELATVLAIDDDATRKYAEAGITIDLPPDHPFVVSEHRRWAAALDRWRVFFAVIERGAGRRGRRRPLYRGALQRAEEKRATAPASPERSAPEPIDRRPVGIAVLDMVDGAPYLDQLSVSMDAMGRGVGRALLARALEWAGGLPLWLTTYDHVPWNRPYYERAGFTVVPEHEWGAEMKAIIASQRASLPHPEARVVMRRA